MIKLMVNDAKKLLLAGLGAAAVTYEKASEVIMSLVEKGKLTVEEGKELSEELKKEVKNSAEETKEKMTKTITNIKPLTKEDLKQVLNEMNYVTKADIIELKRKIEALEEKSK